MKAAKKPHYTKRAYILQRAFTDLSAGTEFRFNFTTKRFEARVNINKTYSFPARLMRTSVEFKVKRNPDGTYFVNEP